MSVQERVMSEIERVTNLPFAHANSEGLAAWLTRPGASITLRPTQAAALAELASANGFAGPIGVGHGKTLIALLAATVLGCERAIILTRSGACPQLTDDEIDARRNFFLRDVTIASYESVSHQKLGDSPVLDLHARGCPDDKLVLVADEAHALKDAASNRTRRVMRFLAERPAVRFVALSGTMTSRNIKDFSHLFSMALGQGSPVPRPQYHIEHAHFSQCVDADGEPTRQDWAAIEPLWRRYYPGTDVFTTPLGQRREMARAIVAHRMAWSLGVHVAAGVSCDASIEITVRSVAVPEVIESAIDYIRKTGDDLDGLPIFDGLSRDHALRSLALGYFFRIVWPSAVTDEQKEAWIGARRHYGYELREEIANFARQDYDSPGLIEETMRRALATRAPNSRLELAFVEWETQKQMIQPDREVVWLDAFLVDYVCDFVAKARQPWLIWYEGIPFADALRARGLPVYGEDSRPETEDGKRSICVSLDAHTESINLQRFSRNLILAPPSSGKKWEQLIGRTHRQNQTADLISVDVLAHTPELGRSIESARRDAAYREQVSGVPERMCFATWRKI